MWDNLNRTKVTCYIHRQELTLSELDQYFDNEKGLGVERRRRESMEYIITREKSTIPILHVIVLYQAIFIKSDIKRSRAKLSSVGFQELRNQ